MSTGPRAAHLPLVVGVVLLGAGPAPVSAQTRMLDVGDAVIRYDVTGQGPPVVFIHGWAQNLSIWDAQVPVFAPRYRVVRFDRRGFGLSTGHADPSADPADLLALLDSLGLRSGHLVGLSGGAAAALRFAMAFPDRVSGLVLYGFGGSGLQGFPVPRPEGQMPDFGAIARAHGMDSLAKAVYRSPLVWRPPGAPDPYENRPTWWKEYSGRDLLDPKPPSGRVPAPRWDRISSLRIPTLIVNGDHDLPYALLLADSLENRLPNARRVVIMEGGHGAHFLQPEQFHRALLGFFASIPTRQ